MSYAAFHVVFLLPPIFVLATTLPQSIRTIGGQRAHWALPTVCFAAFFYTTPWDNYLVSQGVWWYGPGRVLATIGYVPLEEYLFFFLQPVLTGLFLFRYLARSAAPTSPHGVALASWIGAVFFTGCTVVGCMLLGMGNDHGFYLGLVLSWSAPLLAGMWLYDGETLWRYRRTLTFTIGIPTLYLWIADTVAINSGIWTISDQYTLGIALLNLPIEEATFFLMTNALVVKGLLLLLYGSHDSVQSPKEPHSDAPSTE